jgi:hypothetical protein
MSKHHEKGDTFWLNVFLLVMFSLAYAALLYRPPVTNVASLFIALIAAAMVFGEKRPVFKALYFVLILLFTMVEMKAISREHEEVARQETAKRKDENDQFQKIADGINKTIAASDRQFQTTMLATNKLIDESTGLAKLAQQNINATTGGNTYCYVGMSFVGPKFLWVINTVGDSPLHDVVVEQVDVDMSRAAVTNGTLTFEQYQAFTVDYPTIPSLSSKSGRMLAQIPIGDREERNFQFTFFAMNGVWGERMNLRRLNGQWLQAIKVSKEVSPNHVKILYTNIPKEYPMPNGNMDW